MLLVCIWIALRCVWRCWAKYLNSHLSMLPLRILLCKKEYWDKAPQNKSSDLFTTALSSLLKPSYYCVLTKHFFLKNEIP